MSPWHIPQDVNDAIIATITNGITLFMVLIPEMKGYELRLSKTISFCHLRSRYDDSIVYIRLSLDNNIPTQVRKA